MNFDGDHALDLSGCQLWKLVTGFLGVLPYQSVPVAGTAFLWPLVNP